MAFGTAANSELTPAFPNPAEHSAAFVTAIHEMKEEAEELRSRVAAVRGLPDNSKFSLAELLVSCKRVVEQMHTDVTVLESTLVQYGYQPPANAADSCADSHSQTQEAPLLDTTFELVEPAAAAGPAEGGDEASETTTTDAVSAETDATAAPVTPAAAGAVNAFWFDDNNGFGWGRG